MMFASLYVLVLVCLCGISVSVFALPFTHSPYFNETDGLLYVGGMDYELTEHLNHTHWANGTRRTEQVQATGTPACPNSFPVYDSSNCKSMRSGTARCETLSGGGFTTVTFTCASDEICAPFVSANGRSHDQCVSLNYYVRLAFSASQSSQTASVSTSSSSSSYAIGLSGVLTDSKDSYWVTPQSEQFLVNGNQVQSGGFASYALNIGASAASRALKYVVKVGPTQIVHLYFQAYRVT